MWLREAVVGEVRPGAGTPSLPMPWNNPMASNQMRLGDLNDSTEQHRDGEHREVPAGLPWASWAEIPAVVRRNYRRERRRGSRGRERPRPRGRPMSAQPNSSAQATVRRRAPGVEKRTIRALHEPLAVVEQAPELFTVYSREGMPYTVDPPLITGCNELRFFL